MLESPNLYGWYPYLYRWWQRIWNCSTLSSFELIQILVILPKNAISLGIYHEIGSNFFRCTGGCHIHRISNGFYRVTFRSPPKMEIKMEGGGFWKKIVYYFSLPASPPTLLWLESPNLYAWYPYLYRWWQRIWNFSSSSKFQFWNNSDFFGDFTQKYKCSALKKVSLIGGPLMQHISGMFCYMIFMHLCP